MRTALEREGELARTQALDERSGGVRDHVVERPRGPACPPLAMLARPWSVAHATVATRSVSPATTSPAAWPSAMSANGAAKARSAASRSASPAPGRCLPANISSSSAACAGGEADVGRRQRGEPVVEGRPRAGEGLVQRRAPSRSKPSSASASSSACLSAKWRRGAAWLTPSSRASSRSDSSRTPRVRRVSSARSSSAARRLPWW